MRVTIALALLAACVAHAPAPAQEVGSFADLPLRINGGDRVRVVDLSGAKTTGRVVSIGRDGLTLKTSSGERQFFDSTVRRVDRPGQSKTRGVVVGAAAVLAYCSLAKFAEQGAYCAILYETLLGAPMGVIAGAWVPTMRPVYRARMPLPQDSPPVTARATSGAASSPLDDLGMRVNLGDHLTVVNDSGVTRQGKLIGLGDDALTLSTTSDGWAMVTRESVRRVAVRHAHVRLGMLIGFAVGTTVRPPHCVEERRCSWVDTVLQGEVGALWGALAGLVVRRSTVVYPAPMLPISLSPAVTRGGVGIRASLCF